MNNRITIELDLEDAHLVRGIVDNYANFRAYTSTNVSNRSKAQKLADEINFSIVQQSVEQEHVEDKGVFSGSADQAVS